jgi:hypothetical protein
MRASRVRVAAVAAVIVVAGALATGAAWARGNGSGIVGKVYVGPLSPVRHSIVGMDGDEAPYAATIIVTAQDGSKQVTRVRSDDRGEFRLVLPPGMYELDPQPTSEPFPFARRYRVRVERGAYTDVVVLYDTQIR